MELAPHVDVNAPDGGPYWWACAHPERPSNGWALWNWGCDPCYFHLVAHVERGGFADQRSHSGEMEFEHAHGSQALARCNEWRRESGLMVIESKVTSDGR